MLSDLCIRRPIFATVLSILIVLAGIVAMRALPLSQYPNITPPTVTISTQYDGANAQTLSRTVAAPIENQLSGIEGLTYYTTSIRANGAVRIQCLFDVGTDPNYAMLEINNRVRTAERRLPEQVRQNGVNVRKRSDEVLMLVAMYSPDGSLKPIEVADYALLNIVDNLKRIPGISDVSVFGNTESAMRIWLDPQRMARLGVTVSEIENALNDKNMERGAGTIGGMPTTSTQQLYYTSRSPGRRLTPAEFADIIIKTDEAGTPIRISDVADVEVGNRSYEMVNVYNGKPAITLGIFLQTGSNALAAADGVKAELDRVAKDYPQNKIAHEITDDTTVFVKASLKEVLKTLSEAGLLVLIVVFLFLQNARTTLIPMLAVPVSLIGTMAGLWAMGFSLNTLTLFAMTLAIGIVVDDAIVVLENVERLMRFEGLSAFDAARKAMKEVAGALVAIVLVLSAIFTPVAFLGGIAGELYRQFAVTVAVSVCLSGFVALTLTPALCAVLLKNEKPSTSRFFKVFNAGLARFTYGYLQLVKLALKHRVVTAVLLVATAVGCWQMVQITPTSFMPVEDQGIVRMSMQLPDGTSFNRTLKETEAVRKDLSENLPGVSSILVMTGNDQQASDIRPNVATYVVRLTDWDRRDLTAAQIRQKMQAIANKAVDSVSVTSLPAAIRGLGSTNGFTGYVESRGSDDTTALKQVTDDFMAALAQRPELTSLRTLQRAETPMLSVVLDEDKAMRLGISTSEVYDTLSALFAGNYVNDFTRNGRTYRVIIQAKAEARQTPEDFGKAWVKASSGEMVPLGSILTVTRITGADSLSRMNGYLAAQFMGAAVQGVSSGEAIAIVEQVADEVLPEGYAIEWTGQAWHEKRIGASSSTAVLYGLIIIFLILAALYERWSLPVAVVLALPYAILGAFVSLWFRGTANDIYFQIGLLVLIGLTSKNAILIVEFALLKMQEGMSVFDAVIEAAHLRLRPILMTSLAFVLGVVPLVFATGPGAAARHSMGTGVFGGMIAATFIATIFVPVFFTWFVRKNKSGRSAQQTLVDNTAVGQAKAAAVAAGEAAAPAAGGVSEASTTSAPAAQPSSNKKEP